MWQSTETKRERENGGDHDLVTVRLMTTASENAKFRVLSRQPGRVSKKMTTSALNETSHLYMSYTVMPKV